MNIGGSSEHFEDVEILKLEKGFFGILCDADDRIKVGSACIAGY